jgi:hypothetical protein
MFEEVRRRNSSSHHSVSVKERQTLQTLKHCVFWEEGGGQLFTDFGISPEWFRNFISTKSEVRVY